MKVDHYFGTLSANRKARRHRKNKMAKPLLRNTSLPPTKTSEVRCLGGKILFLSSGCRHFTFSVSTCFSVYSDEATSLEAKTIDCLHRTLFLCRITLDFFFIIYLFFSKWTNFLFPLCKKTALLCYIMYYF